MPIAAGNVQYTYAQLVGIWQQAGGNPQYGSMAAAIAMAESGGNSAAYGNNSNGSVDRGLWQINSVHGSQSSFDVMTNARAAVALSNNGVSWRAWCTAYSDAACGTKGGTYLGAGAPYQKFVQGSVPPDLSAPINGTNAAANQPNAQLTSGCSTWEQIVCPGCCLASSAVGSATGKVAGDIINGLVGSLINPLIQITAGVLGIVGGSVLMVGGIFVIIQQSQTVRSAEKFAIGAATAPETGGASIAATSPKPGMRSPDQAQASATSRELNRRQRQAADQEAKQLTTQQLLQREAQRYAGRTQPA